MAATGKDLLSSPGAATSAGSSSTSSAAASPSLSLNAAQAKEKAKQDAVAAAQAAIAAVEKITGLKAPANAIPGVGVTESAPTSPEHKQMNGMHYAGVGDSQEIETVHPSSANGDDDAAASRPPTTGWGPDGQLGGPGSIMNRSAELSDMNGGGVGVGSLADAKKLASERKEEALAALVAAKAAAAREEEEWQRRVSEADPNRRRTVCVFVYVAYVEHCGRFISSHFEGFHVVFIVLKERDVAQWRDQASKVNMQLPRCPLHFPRV